MQSLKTLLSLSVFLVSTASAQLIRPQSAVAGSEFSSTYDIGNVIDGSGLPAGFTAASLHAAYSANNNHWTTQFGAIANGTAFAEFFFNQPQDLGQLILWNHQSNGIASDPNYAVTRFDLVFKDAAGAPIFEALDCVAIGGVGDGSSQTFSFPGVGGVSSVLFTIDSNGQPGGTSGFTGLAEIAFGPSINIGTNYCSPALNSTGQRGRMTATGSTAVALNDVTLHGERMPAGATGMFLVSRGQGSVPVASGVFCLSGTVGRYQEQLFQAGPSGTASLAIDLTAVPQAGPTSAVVAGETWYFQAWHRDSDAGQATSNFTDGLALTFL